MNKELSQISPDFIENRIFTIRGKQVMIDRDLAKIYDVNTSTLNQAVKRNIDRFPVDFRFQLTKNEFDIWKSQIVISNDDKRGLRKLPFAFTEQGVSMLSAVLRSQTAVKVSIAIMNAFVQMRKSLSNHQQLLQLSDELHQHKIETKENFEKIFNALEYPDIKPKQGIFFDGQVFDALSFASQIIRSANHEIIIIDNYIDDTVLALISKKNPDVNCFILTKNINKQLINDMQKFNKQYGKLTIKSFNKSHDRFVIIDQKKIYHIGASLKDLGKKWFAFSEMSKTSINIMNQFRNELKKT